jgi:hypothetical protein
VLAEGVGFAGICELSRTCLHGVSFALVKLILCLGTSDQFRKGECWTCFCLATWYCAGDSTKVKL